MSLDPIKTPRAVTAWARLESSHITPLGNAEGTIAVLSAILSDESPDALIQYNTQDIDGAKTIAREILRNRVARLEIDRRSLQRFIGSPNQATFLEGVWLKLTFASEPNSNSRRIPLRSPDLEGRLFLVGATLVVLEKFSAFIELIFDFCKVSAEYISETIDQHLPSCDHLDLPYANVMDVGQGGMVTVQQSRRPAIPQLFFDFGWPLRPFEKTAPVPPNLDTVHNAPVVLTHWDFDHFAFALDDVKSNAYVWRSRADDRDWLVPGIGVKWGDVLPSVTGIFWALHLFLVGKLKVWPDTLAGLTTGFVTIAKTVPYSPCKGDANQHGLFMLLHDCVRPNSGDKTEKAVRAIMIPGDADYQAIKHALYPNLTVADPFPIGIFDWKGLVATHHGGEFSYAILPSTTLPRAKGHAPKGILAISVGQTKYGHPTARAQQAYLMNGRWRHHTLTYNRRLFCPDCVSLGCFACYCCFNAPPPRGTVELRLDDNRTQRGCPLDWQSFQ